MTETTTVGVVGCGGISPAYLTAPGRFPSIRVTACADLDLERAKERAHQFGVPTACGVDDLLASDVEVVVNLTPPAAHHALTMRAIAAGKSVWSEKPLAVDRAQAAEATAAARERGVLLGCAPDTFLSPAFQMARNLVDWGAIGKPVGASAFFASHGPESSHADPAFLYRPGAGPLLDMGPYYLTVLTSLLGPVTRVSGAAATGTTQRVVGSGPRAGDVIEVQTPTHVLAGLTFAGGAVATMMTSFDVWATGLPRIEIYGTGGTLALPDPDEYGGVVRWLQAGWTDWREVPVDPYRAGRGMGLADLARALRTGDEPRAHAEQAAHVLDVLLSVLESHESGTHLDIPTVFTRGPQVGPAGVENG